MNDGFNNLMNATVEVVDTARRLKAAFAEAGMWIDDDRVAQLAVEVVAMARDAGPEPVMVPDGVERPTGKAASMQDVVKRSEDAMARTKEKWIRAMRKGRR